MKHIYILAVIAIFSLNSSYAQKSKQKTAMSVNTSFNLSSNDKVLKVYPNPSSNFIQVKGLGEAENYVLYNFYGLKISEGSISSEDKINIQNLKDGIYFLVFDKKDKLIFVKE
jgi:hypothetical protein